MSRPPRGAARPAPPRARWLAAPSAALAAALIAGLAALGGCTPGADAPDADDLQPAPSGLQAPVPEAAPGDLAPPLAGRLVAAERGDRTCTLTLADDIGTEARVEATLDACEGAPLGQRVELVYEEVAVPAERCGDRPEDCLGTDTMLLAVELAAAE